MLYDKYKQKMLKFKNAIKTVLKYRVLCFCIILFILTVITGLLMAKGTVYASAKSPGEVVYGDTINYTAKAFWGDVYYEYNVDGKWVKTAPTTIGKYQIRACAKGSFGMIKKGKAKSFSIVPKSIEICVSSNELIYGDSPIATGGLRSGDQFGFVEFNYENVTLDGSNITPIADTVVIIDSSGKDVTKCYTIQSVNTRVTTLKRPIEITVQSVDKIYDGTPLSASAYEITTGSTAYADQVSATFNSAITNVGSLENVGEFVVTAEDGTIVTHMYDVSVVSGYLTVNPRPITVYTGSAEKEYDGTSLSNEEIGVAEGSLISPHELYKVSTPTITNAGEIVNEVEVKVSSCAIGFGNEEDVTSNYAIEYQYGNLTITPRRVDITTLDRSWIYDGVEYATGGSFQQTSSTKILDGHSATDANTTLVKDVGVYVNEYTLVISDGVNDLTANYEFNYTYGNITITARQVNLISASSGHVYDGEDFSCEEFIKDNVVSFHTVDVDTCTIIRNVGQTPNQQTYKIYDENGNDVTHNYDIDDSRKGTLTVTKRRIVFVPRDVNVIYNGQTHRASIIDVSANSPNDIVQGHTHEGEFDQNDEYSRKYAGSAYSRIVSDTFKIYDDRGAERVDVTENYDIVFEDGNIMVTARTIRLQPEQLNRVYNGENHSASGVGIIDVSTQADEGLVLGDVIDGYTIVGEGGPDVGTYTSRIVANSVIILSNGTDIAHTSPPSYNVVCVDGSIVVSKRPITLRPKNERKIYDGTPLIADEWEWSPNTQYGLVLDHVIYTFETSGSQIDVGESNSVITSVIILTGNYSRNVTDNYEIIKETGTLTVDKRPITIKPVDTTVVYNGQLQSIHYAQIAPSSPYGLVFGHSIDYDGPVTQGVGPNYGSYECAVIEGNVYIVSSSGGDISSNYDISYETGWLIIEQREIHIKPRDTMKEYDGTPLTCNVAEAAITSPNSLIDGHILTIVTDGSVINVADGQIDNHIISFSIVDEYGNNVASNYIFVSCVGKLSISHRNITLKAADANKIYDGTPLITTSVFVTSGSFAYGQSPSQISIGGSRTDVGYGNSYVVEGSVVIVSSSLEDVTPNYRITYETGVLTVEKRPICIVTKGGTWQYDGNVHYNLDYEDPYYNDYYVGQIPPALVLDHYLEFVDYTRVINVGEYDNEMVFAIKDVGGNDQTDNYDISQVNEKLIITPILLSVSTGSGSWTYDGYYHSKQEFTYVTNNRPIDGHYLVIEDYTQVFNVTDVEVDNVLYFDVIDDYGTSQRGNYEIDVDYGSLTVSPRTLYIESSSSTWIYNGQNNSDRGYTIINGSLADGDSIEVVTSTIVKDVTNGQVDNEMTIIVKRGNGASAVATTSNYIILVQYGKLEVLHKEVTLKPYDSAVYNGELQSAISLTATDGTSLVAGHRATAQTIDSHVDIGVYDATIVNGSVVIVDEQGQDVTSNYAITTSVGQFEITTRNLYVIADDDTKVYDGEPLTRETYTIEGLVTSIHQVVSVDVTGSIVDVGVEDNVASNVVIQTLAGEPINMGNYNVIYVDGRLTVTPRVMEFSSGSSEKRFDGEPLYCEEYEIISGEVVDGHFVYFVSSAQITMPGSKVNSMSFAVTNEDGSIDYTHNYKFVNVDPGILKVTPIKVTVTTGTASKYYDGTPLTCDEYDIFVEGGECNGHEIDVNVIGTITEPGETRNEFEFTVIYDGRDVTDGYEVIAEWGTLTVLSKTRVELKPRDEIKEYDGDALLPSVLEGFDELEALGYYYEDLTFGGYQIDYGRSASCIESINIYDSEDNLVYAYHWLNGEEVYVEEFEFILSEGTLEVTKIQVKIRLFDVSKYYDGTPISYEEDEYIVLDDKGLTLDIRLGGTLTNVGELSYDQIREASTYYFYDVYGNDVTDNYYLFIEGNPLSVKKRDIEVRSITATKKYDGEELASDEAWISQGSLVSGHTIEFVLTQSIIHVGSIENEIDSIIIWNGAEDVTQNYNITEIYGLLVVTPMDD